MKPKSKAESRHAAESGGKKLRVYYAGSKPFMKRKLARARRRDEKHIVIDIDEKLYET